MLSDEIRLALLSSPKWKAYKKRDRILFRCPRHEDRTPSAWMGGGAWGCFACGFEENIKSLAEALDIPLEGSGRGYTLEDYAADKSFPLDVLRRWMLHSEQVSGREVVVIPYFDTDGELLRRRFRDRSGKWWEGRNRPIYPYGLDHLPEQDGSVVIVVEGESDCHALWLHGFNAIGVPGASTWKHEWAEYLRGFDLFVWEEPDQGGPTMVKRLASSFPDIRVLRASEARVKDVAELHRQDKASFSDRLRALMATAVPVGTPTPPVVFDALLSSRISQLEAQKTAPIDAVPTPFPAWNKACRGAGGSQGLARGWHIIAAAKTGAGKSILAANLTRYAIEAGERVAFISLEMSQDELETRLLAIVSGQSIATLEQGDKFSVESLRMAGRSMAAIHERCGGCVYINREPIHSLDDVVNSMHFNHDIHGTKYFIVDYLQLAGNPLKPETIVEVSNTIRRVTKDLRVITVGLSQFNRATTAAKEKPTKEGLMGGSALENDADQVVLIDHSRTQRDPRGADAFLTWALLDKNRHGPLAEIPLRFETRNLRMTERMLDELPSIEAA